jgi:hypothetical protein
MYPSLLIKHNIGNTLTIQNRLDVRVATYTNNVFLSGVTSIGADNTSDFTSGSTILLLLGSLGNENAEIVTSTAHSATAFTTSATVQNHARGEAIQEIKWDKLQIFKSATIDGVYAQVGSDITLNVTNVNTVIYDTAGTTSEYYKVRWKNSLDSTTSDYSGPISVLSYPLTSPGYMFESVRALFGIKENDTQITSQFLLTALNDGRSFMQSKLYGIRQPWQQEFNKPIKVLAGSNYINLPDDIDFEHTDQSLLAARFLTNNILVPYNMRYCDKRTWNQVAYYSTGGISQVDAAIAATTITLNSVGDFAPQGGTASVATTDFDQVVMQIEYTSIDYTTNQLLGVTGVTRAIPAGTQIWSRASMNQPVWYTVFDNKIWFSSIIPDNMQANNCYIDYYKKMEPITDLYAEIPEHYRESYKPYLRWAIKYRKDITLPQSDPDLVKFQENITAVFNNLYSGQDQIIITS